MEMNIRMNGKLALLLALVAMLTLTSVSAAYSYSSVLTTAGSISAEYLTLNVYDESGTSPRSEIVFNVPPEGTVSPSGVLSDDAVFTLSTPSMIKVTSSAHALPGEGSTRQSFLWGYFTADTNFGVTVEKLEIHMTCNGSPVVYTIYRDAFNTPALITLGEDGDLFNADLAITSVVAHFYKGIVFVNNSVPVSYNGSSSSTDVDKDVAISLNGFEFHFLASRTNLLS